MKSIFFFLFTGVIGTFFFSGKMEVAHGIDIRKASTVPGFAVFELFTSEGCSSCPAADALLARLQKENQDRQVYILAYHVDYWDRAGWKDTFSNPAYSKRQRQYARWLKNPNVYTPQVVANGKKEFVGSKEYALRSVMSEYLTKPASAALTLKQVKMNHNLVSLQYDAKGMNGGSSLILALVQKDATSKVRSGENAGRTLYHAQIVRQLQTLALNENGIGKGQIEIPTGLENMDLELIAFVQNNSSGEILAATKASLASPEQALNSIIK